MTTTVVAPGTFKTLKQQIAASDTLIIQGGPAGAQAGAFAGGKAENFSPFTNAGLIDIQGGAGAAFGQSPGGGGVLETTSTFTNSGTIMVDAGGAGGVGGYGGTLFVDGRLDIGATGVLVVAGGLAGGGVGGTVLDEASINNAGTILLGGGAGSTPRPTESSGAYLQVGFTLTNSGVLSVGAGLAAPAGSYGRPGLGAVLQDTLLLTNTGTLLVAGSAGGGAQGGQVLVADGRFSAQAVLNNSGLIELDGADGQGYAGYGGTLVNTGVLTNSGTLAALSGAGVTEVGPYNYGYPGGGEVDNFGTLTNTGSMLVGGATPGAGSYAFAGGPGYLYNANQLTNSGTIAIAGGAPNAFYGAAGQAYGSINDRGVLTNTGLIVVGGGEGGYDGTYSKVVSGELSVTGTMMNAGTVHLYGGLPTTSDYRGGHGGLLSIGGQFTDSGAIVMDAGMGTGYHGGFAGKIEVGYDGLLTLAHGSVLGQGTLFNSGTLTGTGTVTAAEFDNRGTVIASGGLLSIDAAISQVPGYVQNAPPAAFAVKAGGTLRLSGSIVHGPQTVNPRVLLQSGGLLQLTAATAGVAVFSPSGGTLDVIGGGSATLAAVDSHLSVFLAQAGSLTLSTMAFVSATGSGGKDTLTALAAGQTLTGGSGADVLVGAAATGDTFKDAAAGLNGDTLGGFAGSDVIDITDLAPGGLMLDYEQHGASGLLTVSEGGKSSAITLTGTFGLASFTVASDQHGGSLIGLQH